MTGDVDEAIVPTSCQLDNRSEELERKIRDVVVKGHSRLSWVRMEIGVLFSTPRKFSLDEF